MTLCLQRAVLNLGSMQWGEDPIIHIRVDTLPLVFFLLLVDNTVQGLPSTLVALKAKQAFCLTRGMYATGTVVIAFSNQFYFATPNPSA